MGTCAISRACSGPQSAGFDAAGFGVALGGGGACFVPPQPASASAAAIT
jgi:hypothetical protein